MIYCPASPVFWRLRACSDRPVDRFRQQVETVLPDSQRLDGNLFILCPRNSGGIPTGIRAWLFQKMPSMCCVRRVTMIAKSTSRFTDDFLDKAGEGSPHCRLHGISCYTRTQI
jgi:hypothetical protein